MIAAIRRRLARPVRARARAAQARGDWETALAEYQRVVRLVGPRPLLMLQIGHMLIELGRHEEAAASLQAAVRDPEVGLRALIGLAGLNERAEDWTAAVEAWEAVLARMAEQEGTLQPASWPMSPAVVLLHVAKCREVTGDALGAAREFAGALVLEPRVRFSQEAVLLRARMLLQTSRADAVRFLERSHKAFADDAGIALLLLRTTLEMGQKDAASGLARRLSASVRKNPGVETLLEESGLLNSATMS